MSMEGSRPLIGCIADDFTGATDLAGLLAQSGMRVTQTFGIPVDDQLASDHQAVVVALKTRSVDPRVAVEQSLAAVDWLESLGVPRFYFKYCSTFDSTPRGNIGPVAEALMERLDVERTIFCPAFPVNQRTVYRGHLFVGDRLLNESGMENHPLNPMTDANLVRVLGAQATRPVGLLRTEEPLESYRAIAEPLVIADCSSQRDLADLSVMLADEKLVTGGSALAGGIARVLKRNGEFAAIDPAACSFHRHGPAAVVAGSCSVATQAQVHAFGADHPWLQLDIISAAQGEDVRVAAKRWVDEHLSAAPLLISSTTDPESLRQIQGTLGVERAAEVTESLLSELSQHLVDRGIRRLVVAGGETSGAVVSRLGIAAIRIGPEICPGVPWTERVGAPPLALALKSGNFGGEHFFAEALGLRCRKESR